MLFGGCVSISGPEELAALKAAGAVVRRVLDAMKKQVRPGVTTGELDAIGAEVMRASGAESAPSKVYRFPGANCISINEEAVHGVPGDRRLREGDLLTLDVTSEEGERLIACAHRAFEKAMLVARAGFRVSEIGRVVEREVRRDGFAVIRELGGHGIGRTIHEEPRVPNYPDPNLRRVLTEGLVIAVEPIISAGSGKAMLAEDGWTMKTADNRPAAHYEHTIVVTKGVPVLLTA